MESGEVNVSAWPMECAPRTKMQERFPKWLHREAGIVKAVVEWA